MCVTKLMGGKLVIGVEKVTYSGYMMVDQLHLDVEDVELQTEDWETYIETEDLEEVYNEPNIY